VNNVLAPGRDRLDGIRVSIQPDGDSTALPFASSSSESVMQQLIDELSATPTVTLECDDFVWSRNTVINNIVDIWQESLPKAVPLVALAPYKLVCLADLVYTEETLETSHLIAILTGKLVPPCCPPTPYVECLLVVRLGRKLFIRNGNHRVFLLRRLGYTHAWARVFNGNHFLRR
jgi:hypothetical protein